MRKCFIITITIASLAILLVAGAVVFREELVRLAAVRFLAGDGQLTLTRLDGLRVDTRQLAIGELEFLLHDSQQRLVVTGLDVDIRVSSLLRIPEVDAVTVASVQLFPGDEGLADEGEARADSDGSITDTKLGEVLKLLREFPLARIAVDELRVPQRRAPLAFTLDRGNGTLDAALTSEDLQLRAQFSQPQADGAARFNVALQRGAVRAVDVALVLTPDDDAYTVSGTGRIDVDDLNALLGALEQAPLPIPLRSAALDWDLAGAIADDLDGGLFANDPRTFVVGLQSGSRAVLQAGLVEGLGELSVESTGRTELTITTGAGLSLSGNLPLKANSSLDGEALGTDAQWRLVDCALAADGPCAINFGGAAHYGTYALNGSISMGVRGSGAYDLVTRNLVLEGLPNWLPQADLRAALRHDADAGTLAFDTTLFARNTPTPLDVPVVGTYRLDSGAADFKLTLPEVEFTDQGRALSAWFGAWPYAFDVLAGRVNAEADLQWRDGELRGAVSGNLHELGGFYAEYFFRGLDGELQASVDTAGALPISTPPLALTVAGVDVGLPMENLRLDFRIDTNGVLHIASFTTDILEGTITGANIDYDFTRERNDILVTFTGLQIERMLDLIEYKGVEANGAVSGVIPLTVTSTGVEVAQGRLAADAPGGNIRYLAAADGATGNAGLDLVHQALGNYRFDTLTSGIEYTPDGELVLSMKLQGHNPDMPNGQRINLNLNLSDNVPALLESLQAARKINDFLEEQYQ
jgi:hypothetical protein